MPPPLPSQQESACLPAYVEAYGHQSSVEWHERHLPEQEGDQRANHQGTYFGTHAQAQQQVPACPLYGVSNQQQLTQHGEAVLYHVQMSQSAAVARLQGLMP